MQGATFPACATLPTHETHAPPLRRPTYLMNATWMRLPPAPTNLRNAKQRVRYYLTSVIKGRCPYPIIWPNWLTHLTVATSTANCKWWGQVRCSQHNLSKINIHIGRTHFSMERCTSLQVQCLTRIYRLHGDWQMPAYRGVVDNSQLWYHIHWF